MAGRVCLIDMPKTLFAYGDWTAREMLDYEVPQLQLFFEANPLYFEKVNGQPPTPTEGLDEFNHLPPPDMPFNHRWTLVATDTHGEWIAITHLLSDFLAPGVWHIGLFIVATRWHGGGHAQGLYRALEQWMAEQGAQWVRLGAVAGWNKAENFWQRQGFTQVRMREGMASGQRVNNVRVLIKPLAGGMLDDYLQMVKRDNPDAT